MKDKAKVISNGLVTKSKFISIVIVFSLIVILNTMEAKSQSFDSLQSELPSTITIGIRPPAKSIGHQRESGSWSGFCYFFGKELQSELKRDNFDVEVNFYPQPIVNSYIGENAPRYDGLKTESVDIECGPNTILNREQLIHKGWEHISFSQPFHTTGIKLLGKKDSFSKFTSNFSSEEIEKIKIMKIGVVRQTTTYNALKKVGYRPIPFEKREELLQELENNNIDAYASDALILKSLLEEDYRNINSQEKYTLFPQQSNAYLPDIAIENYGIAVLKGTDYEDTLIKKINDTITLPSFKQFRYNLKLAESAQSIHDIILEYTRKMQILDKEKNELKQKLKNSLPKWLLFIAVPTTAIFTLLIQKILKFSK